uniref:ATP-dependent helicase C-terminal domain-containing protein n=1 Tax=Sphingomonas sp. dw_22 TaxID=2721175 RepID=UPI0023E04579
GRGPDRPDAPQRGEGFEVATCIALAFPDRIAKRRDASGENWASAGGRGFRLDPTSPLARAEWLAVAETQGMAAGARILSAAQIDAATVEALFGDHIETRRSIRFDPATGRIEALRERRLGAIRLSSGSDSAASTEEIETALLEGVREHGLALLPWSDTARALRTRAAYAGIDALGDAALLASLDEWLPQALTGKRRLEAVLPEMLTQALQNLLGWDGQKTLDRLAPARFETPAGSSHAIDYAAEAGPTVEMRVQALFGLSEHPTIGSGVPLVLSLTSPAGRPIQTTRDLPGFWKGSWAAVAKEMRGRYPRHPWPDDPAAASATLRTKKADARAAGPR